MLKTISDTTLRNVAAGTILVGGLSSLFFIGKSNGAVVVILLLSLFTGMAINSLRETKPTAAPNTLALTPNTDWWRRPAWIVYLLALLYAISRKMGH